MTQVGGNHACVHPRAVLYVNSELHPHVEIEHELNNLPSRPAADIDLRVSGEFHENTKVGRTESCSASDTFDV